MHQKTSIHHQWVVAATKAVRSEAEAIVFVPNVAKKSPTKEA